MLKKAKKAVKKGDIDEAKLFFEFCIRNYLDTGFTFKAIAAAKLAKSILMNHPRVIAMLIRLYSSAGLDAQAQEEYRISALRLQKNRCGLLKNLNRNEFVDILDIIDILDVKKGASILNQGQAGEEIYVSLSGRLEVTRDSKRVSVMKPGDIFGELGFFHHSRRSAAVKAIDHCTIMQIPAPELRGLCEKHPGIVHALEKIYTQRILKKASEDIFHDPLFDLKQDEITSFHFTRGQTIPIDLNMDLAIVKHGVVEINYNKDGLNHKEFYGPGSTFRKKPGIARANTAVDILRARIDLLGLRNN